MKVHNFTSFCNTRFGTISKEVPASSSSVIPELQRVSLRA